MFVFLDLKYVTSIIKLFLKKSIFWGKWQPKKRLFQKLDVFIFGLKIHILKFKEYIFGENDVYKTNPFEKIEFKTSTVKFKTIFKKYIF